MLIILAIHTIHTIPIHTIRTILTLLTIHMIPIHTIRTILTLLTIHARSPYIAYSPSTIIILTIHHHHTHHTPLFSPYTSYSPFTIIHRPAHRTPCIVRWGATSRWCNGWWSTGHEWTRLTSITTHHSTMQHRSVIKLRTEEIRHYTTTYLLWHHTSYIAGIITLQYTHPTPTHTLTHSTRRLSGYPQ
jgi:hypothetical protein